jgi:glycosyltransferase involved in cell wall biosynthesis
MDVIIHAAALLKDHPKIRFRIGGDGMCRPQIVQMIRDLSLDNIELLGWIPFAELPAQIARATLCLGGHFSAIPKASRVISTKTFQFLAMKKPTIVGINVATAELFDYETHVIGVPMNDPRALADAILALADDSPRRSRVASAGFELFREKLSTPAIARSLTDVVTRTVCASRL